MAKKTSNATEAKKKAKSKKPTQERIRQVFGECAVAVGMGIEAIKHWAKRYWKTISKALQKRNWSEDRNTVLLQARKMGRNAAKAALEKPAKDGTITITYPNARTASVYIEHEPLCKVPPDKESGRGKYCAP